VRTRLAYGMDTGPPAAAKGLAGTGAASAASTQVPAGTAALRSGGSSSASSASGGGAAAGRQSLQHGAASSSSSPSHGQPHKLNIRGVLRHTLQTEGVMGLYRGIGPTVVGILPYAGLKFYVYQSLKQQYRAATGRDEDHRLPVPLMLTFGAISGLIGQASAVRNLSAACQLFGSSTGNGQRVSPALAYVAVLGTVTTHMVDSEFGCSCGVSRPRPCSSLTSACWRVHQTLQPQGAR
jgi:Mitochondrial carrier protein